MFDIYMYGIFISFVVFLALGIKMAIDNNKDNPFYYASGVAVCAMIWPAVVLYVIFDKAIK